MGSSQERWPNHLVCTLRCLQRSNSKIPTRPVQKPSRFLSDHNGPDLRKTKKNASCHIPLPVTAVWRQLYGGRGWRDAQQLRLAESCEQAWGICLGRAHPPGNLQTFESANAADSNCNSNNKIHCLEMLPCVHKCICKCLSMTAMSKVTSVTATYSSK